MTVLVKRLIRSNESIIKMHCSIFRYHREKSCVLALIALRTEQIGAGVPVLDVADNVVHNVAQLMVILRARIVLVCHDHK